MNKLITIVDYGMGNIGSIANMFRKVGAATSVAKLPEDLATASAIVLPGVGAFDHGMERLNASGLSAALHERVLIDKVPVLGICLGMQLMTEGSEEGLLPGLGWIRGVCTRFRFAPVLGLKVPHMGWNTAVAVKPSALFDPQAPHSRFYFVHSFRLVETEHEDILTTTVHGESFVSGFQKANITGFQFHPEKSHRYGINLLKSFVAELQPC